MTPFLIVRNGEAVDSSANMVDACACARREAGEYSSDTVFIYEMVAEVKTSITTKIIPRVPVSK